MVSRQFLVFVGVGGACAALDLLCFHALLSQGVRPSWAAAIAFLSSVLANYTLHARVTFSSSFTPKSVGRFMVVVLANLALVVALVALSDKLFASGWPGKLLSLPVIAIHGFLWSKYWVFR